MGRLPARVNQRHFVLGVGKVHSWHEHLERKSASGSILAKRNLAEQYFSSAEGLCMPIETVTSVEEGQSAWVQCSFMAALLSQGKGLQREPMRPAGGMMNGVTIVEEIRKRRSAPSPPITAAV